MGQIYFETIGILIMDYNISNLYSFQYLGSSFIKKETWHEWFAWYPIHKVIWRDMGELDPEFEGYKLRVWKYVWLRKIHRRKVYFETDIHGLISTYEYVDTEDLLLYDFD